MKRPRPFGPPRTTFHYRFPSRTLLTAYEAGDMAKRAGSARETREMGMRLQRGLTADVSRRLFSGLVQP